MSLSAANEAVLMAVDGIACERELATPAKVGLESQPPMTTAEVMTIAGLL